MAKSGKFLATLFGIAAGAIGGLLLAPQSGKKTREDLKRMALKLSKEISDTIKDTKEKVEEIFGKATEKTIAKYKEIKSTVVNKVAEVKNTGKEIDKEKYIKIVEGVVEEFKDDFTETKDGATKMIALMKKDWEKIKKALV
jgi:gas vesicle protein